MIKIPSFCVSIVLAGLLYFSAVGTVRAQAIIFQDNFDGSGSYSWTTARNMQYLDFTRPCLYFSQAAQWSQMSGRLTINIAGPPCITEYVPVGLDLSSLPHGYSYEFDMTLQDHAWQDRNALFLWKDALNWYDLHIFGDWVWIQKSVNGTIRDMGGFRYGFANNSATYNFKFEMHKNHIIQLLINGVQTVRMEDPIPYFTGPYTIGLQASVGSGVSYSLTDFDNVMVRALPPPASDGEQLSIEILKQTDPRWKNQIYDTATTWSSSPTIGRWGCALTSMAMILRFHQITQLPNGTELMPDTLNTWLKSQSDGYTSAGLINWSAITRLTRLVSERIGTTKLEYTRTTGSVSVAQTEIRADKPVMLEIPGHFLVGDGIPADTSTLNIKDPVYDYTTLKQHNTSLLSVRKFEPSQTDLSYLFFEHSPQLLFSLKDKNGQPIADLQTFSDRITDPIDNSGESNPAMIQSEWAKPASGSYILEVSRTSPGPFSLDTFTYDTAANPSTFRPQGFVDSVPMTFRLTYNREGTSVLKPLVDFAQFRRDLKIMSALKHITRASTYLQLNRTAELGMAATTKAQRLRYAALIQTQLTQQALSITTTGKGFLNQEVRYLTDYLK